VKQRYLQQVYGMCSDKDELERALGLTRLNYLARGGLQQHDPFSHKTFSLLLQQAMKLDAPEIAKRVLLQSTEFGFSPANTRLYNGVLIYHSKQMDLRSMLEMYEMMKRSGPVPDSETCFILVKGCVDAGRADIAQAIVSEFDNAGKRVRDGVRLYIQQHVA
jgi:pentatricopeptide repeat protein